MTLRLPVHFLQVLAKRAVASWKEKALRAQQARREAAKV